MGVNKADFGSKSSLIFEAPQNTNLITKVRNKVSDIASGVFRGMTCCFFRSKSERLPIAEVVETQSALVVKDSSFSNLSTKIDDVKSGSDIESNKRYYDSINTDKPLEDTADSTAEAANKIKKPVKSNHRTPLSWEDSLKYATKRVTENSFGDKIEVDNCHHMDWIYDDIKKFFIYCAKHNLELDESSNFFKQIMWYGNRMNCRKDDSFTKDNLEKIRIDLQAKFLYMCSRQSLTPEDEHAIRQGIPGLPFGGNVPIDVETLRYGGVASPRAVQRS